MADAYRGLTIRIGGDATGLTKALKNVNGAIRVTEGQLRTLGKAMQLNPNNAKAAELQIGAIARQAQNTSIKLEVLKDAYNQLGSSTALTNGAKTIEELARETDNATLSASRATDRYNTINMQLERYYRQLTKLSSEYGRALEFNHDNNHMTRIKHELDLIVEKEGLTQRQAESMAVAISNLKSKWLPAFKEMKDATNVAGLEKLEIDVAAAQSAVDSYVQSLVRAASTSDLSRSLKDIDARIVAVSAATDVATNRFERLDAALKLDPFNLDLAKERMEALKEATELARVRADELQRKMRAYEAAGIDKVAKNTQNAALSAEAAKVAYGRAETEVARLKGELDKAEVSAARMRESGKTSGAAWVNAHKAIRQVKEQLREAEQNAARAKERLDVSAAVVEYQELGVAVREVNAELRRTSDAYRAWEGFTGAAQVLSAAFTNYINQGLTSAAESARQVDAAYRDLRKTTEATEDQYEALLATAKEFSLTHVTSADQLLEIQALGGQFGIAANQLEGFSIAISNIEVATDLDAQQAALSIGQLIGVLDDFRPEQAENFADALVRLGNKLPATESSILNVAQRIAPISSVMSISTADILAWSAALASTGQRSEAAGTALSRTMLQIEEAVAEGGDALNEFARLSGRTAEEFKNDWKSDASGVMVDFIHGLAQLDMDDESVVESLEKLGISSIRQEGALLGLSEGVQVLDTAMRHANEAWRDGGDAAEEARKKAEGFSGQMSILDNSIQLLASEFGEGLVPHIALATDMIQSLLSVVGSWDESTKSAVVGIGGMALALSVTAPLLVAIGQSVAALAGGVVAASAAFAGFSGSMFAMATGLPVIGSGIFALVQTLGPLGLLGVLGGVAAAAYAGISIWSNYQEEVHRTERRVAELRDAEIETAPHIRSTTDRLRDEAKAASDTASRLDEATEAHRDLAQTIRETNTSAQENIDNLTWAKTIINDYANESGLMAYQQEQLKEAISIVNEECGTQYSVIDAVNGVIQDEEGVTLDTVDAINRYIEAKQRSMQIDALLSNQRAAYEQFYEDQRVYQQAYEDFMQMQESGVWNEGVNRRFQEAEANMIASAEAVDYYAAEINRASGETGTAAEEFEHMHSNMLLVNAAFGNNEEKINGFMHALEEAGITTEDFERLSEDTINSLIVGYDGVKLKADSVGSALDELDIPHTAELNIIVFGMSTLERAAGIFSSIVSGGMSAVADFGGHAAGGHVPRFASGAIFTGPTMTKHGLIGEAGAEYYDGDTIVPLTNTRYSKPFIDMLANGVVNRLGSGGNVYNVYFDNVRVNSDERITAAFENFMYEIAREADM